MTSDTNNSVYCACDLKILFRNARSVRNKKEDIRIVLKDLDILICVESWLKPTDKNEDQFNFPGFKTFRRDRAEKEGGGIVILIRNSIAFHEIQNLINPSDSLELTGIRITNVNPVVDIYCLYRVPGLKLTQVQWDDLFGFFGGSPDSNALVVGDFNAHNVQWNCEGTDSQGTFLLETVNKFNFILHNSNSKSHINTSNFKESNIDLVFLTQQLAGQLEVEVLDETWNSDHYPIKINLCTSKHAYRKRGFNLKSKKTDWVRFKMVLGNDYDKFLGRDFSEASACNKYLFFITLVTTALKSCTPEKIFVNNRKHRNPVSWWDDECERAKRLRRAAYKRFKYSHSAAEFIEYKRVAALARRLFKFKKRESFRTFASKISFKTGCRYVWDTCRVLKNKWIKVSPSHTSANHQNEEKIRETLDKLCTPPCRVDPEWMPKFQNNEFLDSPFNFLEFNVALESKNEGSACGMDGIDYCVLRNMPIKFKLILVDIFNELHSTGTYSEEWNKSYIHFIGKADGVGVRPISLISCTCKIFETTIKNKLQWWLEHENKLPKHQAGFRKGQSTTDGLVGLTASIEEAFSVGKGLLVTFLDIEGAFNNVVPCILLQTLADLGISGSILFYVRFATSFRRVFNEQLGRDWRALLKGVPQGGVLSPLLFILYIRNIGKGIPRSVILSNFADDSGVFCKWGTLDTCLRLIEKAIKIIVDYSS